MPLYFIWNHFYGNGLGPNATVAAAFYVRYTTLDILSHIFYILYNLSVIHEITLFILWPVYVSIADLCQLLIDTSCVLFLNACRGDMAFIEPMHRNKTNLTYLLT